MPHKINISNNGKSWKIEIEAETLSGKFLGDKINGAEISADLAGYELEITGASDIAGFPHKGDVEGPALKRVLLTKGWGMHKKPKKEGKKKVSTPKGLRLKKTVRGKEISEKTVQINMKVVKEGNKKLPEIFPEQNKAPEPEKPAEATTTPEPAKETPVEKPTQPEAENPKEEKAEEPKTEN